MIVYTFPPVCSPIYYELNPTCQLVFKRQTWKRDQVEYGAVFSTVHFYLHFYSSRRRCLGEPRMFFASFVVVVVVVGVGGETLSDSLHVWTQNTVCV